MKTTQKSTITVYGTNPDKPSTSLSQVKLPTLVKYCYANKTANRKQVAQHCHFLSKEPTDVHTLVNSIKPEIVKM